MKEYKVVMYKEGLLGNIFFAGSKIDPEGFAEELNRHAEQGWRVVAMDRESRRSLLFFNVEAFLVVLERDRR